MNKLIKLVSLAGVTCLLAACNSDDSTDTEALPLNVITAIDKSGELIVGAEVIALSECRGCDADETRYTWIVDQNGSGEFDDVRIVDAETITDRIVEGDTYQVTEADFGKPVKLILDFRFPDAQKLHTFPVVD